MPDINLTQSEAEELMDMEKIRTDDQQYVYPTPGNSICVPLTSVDERENFLLDASRGRIDLAKVKYQNRSRQIVVLVRLDLGGSPHRNPDGEEVSVPHLHLYQEGFGDKWAIAVPADNFSNPSDIFRAMDDFMSYCNITQPPFIGRELFQ